MHWQSGDNRPPFEELLKSQTQPTFSARCCSAESYQGCSCFDSFINAKNDQQYVSGQENYRVVVTLQGAKVNPRQDRS